MTKQLPYAVGWMAALAVSACTPAIDNAPTVAVRYSKIDLGACLSIARGETAASETNCPGFVSASVAETIETCTEVGGELVPVQPPSLQSLDVNGDGQVEFLYDLTENFACKGAPSLLSCGSLGCPVFLFEQHDGAWRTIGILGAIDAVAAEVLPAEAGSAYRTIRGGCAGERPCDELVYYRWNGSAYSAEIIDVNGYWVDVAPGGLWTLIDDASVLASPSPDAAVLGHYPAGTDLVLIGDARDARYKYVSPCNACKSGFVRPDALRKDN